MKWKSTTIDDTGEMTHTSELGQAPEQDALDELERLSKETAAQRAEIENLQIALQASRTIGMALGVIMEREKVSQDEAFARLSRLSQRSNVKARSVAENIALTGDY